MGDLRERLLPGTTTTYFEKGQKGFAKIEMLILATGGLNLSQVCAVTGLEGSTIQNWVKRGWVANPRGKKYDEIHIARILIINALKECIKLEHISRLMSYVNGPNEDKDRAIIKESELFNYLCDALEMMGQADDLSRNGVESIVETVIKNYAGPTPDARDRINKALTVMVFACVCTDVKRRTESMMSHILGELKKQKIAEFTGLTRERTDNEDAGSESLSRESAVPSGSRQADPGQTEPHKADTSLTDTISAQPGQTDDDAAGVFLTDEKPAEEQHNAIQSGKKQMRISQADIERMEQRRANLYLAGKKSSKPANESSENVREKQEAAAAEVAAAEITAVSDGGEPSESAEPSLPRKTIAQALREWDMKPAEEAPLDDVEVTAPAREDSIDAGSAAKEPQQDETPEKPAAKPVYFRRG